MCVKRLLYFLLCLRCAHATSNVCSMQLSCSIGVRIHQSPIRAVESEDWMFRYVSNSGHYHYVYVIDATITELYWNFTLVHDYNTNQEAIISLEYFFDSDAANRFWHNYTLPRTQVYLWSTHKI